MRISELRVAGVPGRAGQGGRWKAIARKLGSLDVGGASASSVSWRLALAAVALPLVLGWAARWAVANGHAEVDAALTWLAVAAAVSHLLLLGLAEARVEVSELGRRRAEGLRRVAEQAAERARAYLQAVIRHVPAGVVVVDASGGEVVLANDRARETWPRAAASAAPIDGPSARLPAGWPLAQVLHRGEVVSGEEITIERDDGSSTVLSVSAAPVRQAGQIVAGVAVLADVTERHAIEEEVVRLALHDALTGLPNRKLLEDRLAQALALAGRNRHQVAVVLIDLDHFKDVNDTLGHPTGDRVLQILAARLEASLRRTDTLARLGGDEFACVLGELSGPAGAAAATGKLQQALSDPMEHDGQLLHLAASAGVAMFPADGRDPVTLLKHADLALHKAKAGGRDRYRFFEPRMDLEAQTRKRLDRDLRRALAQDQLALWYQPQLDLASGRFTAVEALMRWPHPERGFVPPGEFIPVAEASGFIRPLGAWSVRSAFRQAQRWRARGIDAVVAVNVSAAQLRSSDTLDALRDALERSGLDAGWIELELTESLVVEALEATTQGVLRRIVGLGVSLAIDDFGTGYSSLAYLRRLPVQKIKIDRSFVRDLGKDAEALAVVRAIVALGHTLGKTIVAEGVETPEQLGLLRELGCDMAQGYLLARPMDAAAAERMLAAPG